MIKFNYYEALMQMKNIVLFYICVDTLNNVNCFKG